MGNSNASGGDQEDAREQRVRALRELAQAQQPAPDGSSRTSAPGSPMPAPSRRPSLARVGIGLALLGLAVIVVAVFALRGLSLFGGRSTMPHPKQTAVQSVPGENGFRCPVSVAWSPDAKQMALLGYTQCPEAPGSAGVVEVYDAATGKLVAQWQPDAAILQVHAVAALVTPQSSTAPTQIPYIGYQTLLWSPDGARVALPFIFEQAPRYLSVPFLGPGSPLSPIPTVAGVLIADPTGSQARVITAPYRENAARLEWDLTTSTLLSGALTLPPALGYQWGPDGALQPQTPLNAMAAPSAPPPGPVGNPAGGSSFSIWQPGEAGPFYLRGDNGVTTVPNLYLWDSAFAIWSPDGRYLITPAYAGGRVAVPGHPAPAAATLMATGNTQTPVLPARDVALQQLYNAMLGGANGAEVPAQVVAWRPDGKIAATVAEPYFGTSQQGLAPPSVVFYDSATGHLLATLKPRTAFQFPIGNPYTTQGVWLQWSPNGTHLLLLDDETQTLTIWNAGALPR